MKKSKLHIKKTGLKTPDTYFESFEERLFKKMDVQKKMSSITDVGYKVPDNYFDSFDAKLQLRIDNEEQPKVLKFVSWRSAAYVSGIAASLLVMFSFFLRSDNNVSIHQIETASIEDYLYDQNLNIYDIVSLLNTDDLVLDDFVTHKLSDESLENYLLNNASIEDLIIGK